MPVISISSGAIWHDGQGACLFTKRLERGRFLWPSLADGVVTISVAQLSYLLSGIDWRMSQATWRPQASGYPVKLWPFDSRRKSGGIFCGEYD
jgi:transposase